MIPDEIIDGNVYYMLGFSNKDFTIPIIQTLIFVGKRKLKSEHGSAENHWCFQNLSAELVSKAVPDNHDNSSNPRLYCMAESDLEDLVDIDGLIQSLETLRVKK